MFIEVSSFYDRKRASGFNKTNFVNFSGEKKKVNRNFPMCLFLEISIGNSMICSDIWHKYHE